MSLDEARVDLPAVAVERVKPQLAVQADEVPWMQSVWTWFWGGLLLACVPMLGIYLMRMWRLEHYQYFPFAIGIVAWLVWTRSDRRFYPPANYLSLVALAVGGIAFVGAVVLRSPWFIAIAFFCFATACLASMRGRSGGSLLMLALPLLLLVRLPMGYDQLLVIELQRITTALSSVLLDVVRVPHAVDHNVIQLPGRELFVAEACSGIQSVFTLAFLSTLLIAIYQRRLWLAPFYLAIALVLAVAGNVLRVTMVAIAEIWWGLDWATGWTHDLLGYTTLGLSALFLVSFDQWIVCFLRPTRKSSRASKHNPVIQLWNWLVDDGSTVDMVKRYYKSGTDVSLTSEPAYHTKLTSLMNRFQAKPTLIATACMSIILLCVATARAFSVDSLALNTGMGMFVEGVIFDPTDDLFHNVSGDFGLADHQISRDNENPILGWNSDIWRYKTRESGQEIVGQFAISQTYADFHELCLCYQGLNWNLLDRYRREVSNSTGSQELVVGENSNAGNAEQTAGVPVAYALFTNEGGGHGYLWYASIGASGKMKFPPERLGRLGSRLADAMEGDRGDVSEPIMMVQLWVTSPERLDASTTSQITSDFALLRQTVSEHISAEATK